MSDKDWDTFDTILSEELNETGALVAKDSLPVAPTSSDLFSDALEKAKELIQVSEATDVPSLINKMKEQFVTNRLDTASKGERAVNLVLTKLIDKLNNEEMPVNTLLKILTQLRDSSVQDMTAVLGVPSPEESKFGRSGSVIQILNNNGGQSQQPQPQQMLPSQGEASSDISKFLEVSTLALENLKSGKINASEEVKSKIVEAEFSEVDNESK